MIGEAPDAAALRRVDELGPSMSDMRPDHRQQATHLVLLQHHEVEVLDALLRVVAHALLEGRRVDDVSDILVDERVSLDVLLRAQSEALLLRLHDLDGRVLLALEAVR